MPIKQSLRIKQQQGLTPQLHEAIRLMQLSAVELRIEIEAIAESNPLLEVEYKHQTRQEEYSYDYSEKEETEYTLQEYLYSQLNQQPLSEKEEIIGLTLIDSINSEGYLYAPISEIKSTLNEQGIEITEDEIHTILDLIQTFDPAGVGARNLGECLLLQLKRIRSKSNALDYAHKILCEDLKLLTGKKNADLLSRYGLNQEELSKGLALIRSLNPKPGVNYLSVLENSVAPDVIVRKVGDAWVVELNEDLRPQLRINLSVLSLLKQKKDDFHRDYRREKIKEAKWLMQSIENRHLTLMRVAEEIIRHQQAFLEHGSIALRPLTLKTIAEAIDKHESTVSRGCAHKTILTPLGLFEFKFFFSSQLKTHKGSAVSSKALCALIQKLISDEDPTKPYSDNALMKIINAQGIMLARRTIAKYRESLGILPSAERRGI